MRAEIVRIPGHGIYWRVDGKLYATPRPKPWSVPVEISAPVFGTYMVTAGPRQQQGHNIEPPARF